MKNVKFEEIITLKSCLIQASDNIHRNVQNKSSGVKDITNGKRLKNRIAERAKGIYIATNYWTESKIECQHRADHYAMPIGSILKGPIGNSNLSASKSAMLLRDARNMYDEIFDN